MALGYEIAQGLFYRGDYLQLISLSGRSEEDRFALDANVRVLVANALALIGEFEQASTLAELDSQPQTPVRGVTLIVIMQRLALPFEVARA